VRYNLGDFHVTNLYQNLVTAPHVDPAVWARKLGVLADGENVRMTVMLSQLGATLANADMTGAKETVRHFQRRQEKATERRCGRGSRPTCGSSRRRDRHQRSRRLTQQSKP
jgi:hypothetical protein